MSLSLKRLRRRIRSVQSTKQITRAMQMVAAAKLRRSEAQLRAATPYFTQISALVARLLAAAEFSEREGFWNEPLLQPATSAGMMLLLGTADRGLCGAFNANLIRHAEAFLAEHAKSQPSLFCVGKKGYDYFRKRGATIVEKITDMHGNIDPEQIESVADKVEELFRSGAVGQVYMLYGRFVSRMLQPPTLEKLLPIDPSIVARGDKQQPETSVPYIFEPDPAEVVQALVHRYVRSRIYALLAEHITSEHAARVAAMTNATQNCDDLVESLTLQRNKARQASITRELLDIIGGAEALTEGYT